MAYENTPHNCTCLVCGKTFYRPPSHILKRGSGKYCGRSCQGKARVGKRCGRWNGGRTTSRGYVMVAMPGHPLANPKGYIAEHRLVAERMLGRSLTSSEIVHHINGDKADNRPENLQVMTQAKHAALHMTIRFPRGDATV